MPPPMPTRPANPPRRVPIPRAIGVGTDLMSVSAWGGDINSKRRLANSKAVPKRPMKTV